MNPRKIMIRALKRRQLSELDNRKRLYAETGADEQQRIRLDKLNEAWEQAREVSPFYRYWARKYALPDRLETLEQIQNFPLLTKEVLREHQDLVFGDGGGEAAYVTGGSTGSPMRYPKSDDEVPDRWVNGFLGRSWIGIEPGDPYLHPWGHSHLFGGGPQAGVRKVVRAAKDLASGGHRVNGYDRSPEALASVADELLRLKPKYIIGYASYITQLAHHLISHCLPAPSSLEWVIPTSDTSTAEDLEVMARAFGARVAGEYGSVETGLLAHYDATAGALRVPWASIYGALPDPETGIQVTTLDPRRFPLFNYAIGDAVEGVDGVDDIRYLSTVRGRVNQQVAVRRLDGTFANVLPNQYEHMLRAFPTITQVQFAPTSAGELTILATAPAPTWTDAEITARVHEDVRKTDQGIDLTAITVKMVREPTLSVAGKVPKTLPVDAWDGDR